MEECERSCSYATHPHSVNRIGAIMVMTRKVRRKNQRGFALISIFGVLTLVAIATTAYVSSATQTVRIANQNRSETDLQQVCEAGVQHFLVTNWKPFKVAQKFDTLDANFEGATSGNPKGTISSSLDSKRKYSAGAVGYSEVDSYNRVVTIRCVAWNDANNNNAINTNEDRKVVDVQVVFSLGRSAVFDYTYFVNNYGWMTGFGQNDLIVNGDMRANGNFDFSGGTPTVNGSVYASANDKLVPPAEGLVNINPFQHTNSAYNGASQSRRRQAYDETKHGAKGSDEYEKWRDFLYDKAGGAVNNKFFGSIVGDVNGYRTYDNTWIDNTPTQELLMPDLNDITKYTALSNSYVDTRATFDNGAANPDYNQGAYVKVWNSGTNSYQRLDTNGVVSGSGVLIGTTDRPILIHGPVTFTQDCVIKGTIQGQGTVYTGRNIHVVGDVKYKNPPDFRGNDPQQIDNENSAKDMIALAARGSVMMGNTKQYSYPYPLYYMTPPFTKGRYDEYGNWIPPFNALETDSTGKKRYQSVYGDDYINSISQNIHQMDCVLYTNYLGGGRLAEGGGGCVFNGTIISKDEAMVLYSLPMVMNYDHRIRERKITKKPLIDLNLPRTPVLIRSSWQDRGTIRGQA